MPDVYTCSVSFDHVLVTPNPDPAAAASTATGTHLNRVFTGRIAFGATAANQNRWGILAGVDVEDNGSGSTEFKATYELVFNVTLTIIGANTRNAFDWTIFTPRVLLQSAPGGAGAGYFGGGTLSIRKDFLNNRITMITPIGSASATLNENDAILNFTALDDSELLPFNIGMEIHIPSDGVHSPEATESRVQFYNMQADLDGTLIFYTALSAADPGGWDPVFIGDGNSVSPTLTTLGNFHLTQLGSRFEIDNTYTIPTFGNGLTANDGNAVRVLLSSAYVIPGVDMDIAKEHGILFRAGSLPGILTDVVLERSFDNGHTWTLFTVSSDPLATVSSPTVTWYNQRLYVTWQDGNSIKEARSLDAGANWILPITLPFSGMNPRRVVERTGGGVFYFYFNAGNLVVSISYDSGATFDGPFTVTGPAIAQQIDAEFAPDGSIVCSIFIAGVLTQFRSRDLGRVWA